MLRSGQSTMRSHEFPRNLGIPRVMVVEPSDQVIQQEAEQETIRGYGLRIAHPESTATIATATIIRRTVNRRRGNLMSGASVTSVYSRGVS